MKHKLLVLLLTCITVTVCLAGCGSKAPEKKAAASLKELKVTYVKQHLNIPSIVDTANQTIV